MARRRFQNPRPELRGDKWEIRVRQDVTQPDGNALRVQSRVFLGTRADLPTEKLAMRAAKPILDKLNSAFYRPHAATTFEDFAARWQDAMLAEMKPSTAYDYRSILRAHLIPAFGRHQMHAISPEMIQTFIARKRQKISAGRLWNVLSAMRSLWRTAIDWQVVSENPFKHVTFRTPSHKEGRYFTVEDVRKVVSASDEPYRTLYLMAAETGLRSGELFALRCSDVDELANVVFVRQSFSMGVLGRPKSACGLRALPISRELSACIARVKQHRLTADSPLFGLPSGEPLSYWHVVKCHLQPLLKRLGIARAGLHAFRHASASVGAKHATPKVIQERLGHSDAKITLRYYTHTIGEDHRRAAEAIGQEFAPERVM